MEKLLCKIFVFAAWTVMLSQASAAHEFLVGKYSFPKATKTFYSELVVENGPGGGQTITGYYRHSTKVLFCADPVISDVTAVYHLPPNYTPRQHVPFEVLECKSSVPSCGCYSWPGSGFFNQTGKPGVILWDAEFQITIGHNIRFIHKRKRL